MTRRLLAPFALATMLAAAPARGHEVVHEIARGRAVAVRLAYADGEPLAYCAAEVFSPADPRVPFFKGRTDRQGWIAFVPDAPGDWLVRVADATGHGAAVQVAVGRDLLATGEPPSAASGFALALRPIAGLAVLGAAFAALYAVHLRRRSRRP